MQPRADYSAAAEQRINPRGVINAVYGLFRLRIKNRLIMGVGVLYTIF